MIEEHSPSWTLLTNHGHVLICLTRDPDLRIRDLARHIGITDRAVAKLLDELEATGYITRTRVGRRNRYAVHTNQPMRHRVEEGHVVRELVDAMAPIDDQTDPSTP